MKLISSEGLERDGFVSNVYDDAISVGTYYDNGKVRKGRMHFQLENGVWKNNHYSLEFVD